MSVSPDDTPRKNLVDGEISVLVVENSHTFEAEDGTALWLGGFTPVDEDGTFLSVEEHRTSDGRCFFSSVAGTSYRSDALQRENLAPGAQIILRREPHNKHDPNAIAVWDSTGNEQLGYVPADLSPELIALVPPGQDFTEAFGGLIISEFRRDSQSGPRVGLRILVGPVGELTLRMRSREEDESEEEGFSEAVDRFTSNQMARAEEAGTVTVICPACGSTEQAFQGVGGYRCKACQRDVWVLDCHRCHEPCTIFGSFGGSGAVEFRCNHCRAKNTVAVQRLRAVTAEVRRAERAHTAAERETTAQKKAAKAMQADELQREAGKSNKRLQAQLDALNRALATSVAARAFSFAALKMSPVRPVFDPGPLNHKEEAPTLESFLPLEPRGLGALIPGAKRKYEREREAAAAAFEDAIKQYEAREARREADLAEAQADHEAELSAIEDATTRQHAAVDELERRFETGEPGAVAEYFAAALVAGPLPFERPAEPRIGFSPESRQLVIQVQLPTLEAIPEARAHRYVKTRGEIAVTPMPMTERKRRYASLIAQVALLTVDRAFSSDPRGIVETVVVNGHVATIDKRTGRPSNPCLVTVRATSDQFGELDLTQVDPVECLKGLSASLSRSPSELVPVRPVVDFDMADPRFVREEQILETLDTRPNLMELSPKEFESLITNLFEKMGLETRLTQASRDGGVDCVAYDARPIFGGKVVIQAKRYKNTVGVSAVRDLFGTLQNEGATKGILVTTSGYGQASHEFANGKPLELIDGGNLLYLLHEHAAIDAKIEVPEDWVDPPPPD